MKGTDMERFCYDIAGDADMDDEIIEPDEKADDRVLDHRTEVTIEFSYPLRRPVRRTVSGRGGITRRAFAHAVAVGYASIYEEEEKSRTTLPEPRGMLLNRSETDGVHGIWGHGINDLVLEGAYRDDEGVWHLAVGS